MLTTKTNKKIYSFIKIQFLNNKNMATKIPFRKFHLLQILNLYAKSSAPLDLFLRQYFLPKQKRGS